VILNGTALQPVRLGISGWAGAASQPAPARTALPPCLSLAARPRLPSLLPPTAVVPAALPVPHRLPTAAVTASIPSAGSSSSSPTATYAQPNKRSENCC